VKRRTGKALNAIQKNGGLEDFGLKAVILLVQSVLLFVLDRHTYIGLNLQSLDSCCHCADERHGHSPLTQKLIPRMSDISFAFIFKFLNEDGRHAIWVDNLFFLYLLLS
jgi:hypothetical protein